MPIQLQFDPNQDYQLEAIQSVVDLFDGLPRQNTDFTLGADIVPNIPTYDSLAESWLHDNLITVQDRNIQNGQLIDKTMMLEVDDGLMLDDISIDSHRYPSFTIEMETGTGKTYVYLRTIHELRKRYGFGKFIIVVPSIAIYEGVIKTFDITKSHFAALYSNETVNLI